MPEVPVSESDSPTEAMSAPRRPLVERFQTSANRHSTRWGAGVGVSVASALTALVAAVPSSLGVWPWIPLTALIGVACGAGFVITMRYGAFEIPPGTDAARLRAARRAVRKGRLGADPEVNRLAAGMAETAAQQRPPSRIQVVFVAVLAAGAAFLVAWEVVRGEFGSGIAPALLAGVQLVHLAFVARRRRRAAWLVDAYEGRTDRSR